MRQKVRKTLIFISFLLFPVTMWYFSPYLIIQGMSEHILNGSFFVFVSMPDHSGNVGAYSERQFLCVRVHAGAFGFFRQNMVRMAVSGGWIAGMRCRHQ